MKANIKLNLTAIIEGTTCEGVQFKEEAKFELIPPKDDNHYGTGYYMLVNIGPNNRQYIDVRYERTTDIYKLAELFIKSYYGKNCKEYEFKD